MVNLANENTKGGRARYYKGTAERTPRLYKMLSGERLPSRIEAYDVSNLSGSDVVAAMTVFEVALR